LINIQQKNLYIAMSIIILGNIQALGGDLTWGGYLQELLGVSQHEDGWAGSRW